MISQCSAVSGFDPRNLDEIALLSLLKSYQAGTAIIPILQRRELKHRIVKLVNVEAAMPAPESVTSQSCLVQGCSESQENMTTTGHCQSQLNSFLSDLIQV